MTMKHTFRAIIEDAGGGGAFISVPFDAEQAFGKKRIKVNATIEGEPYRGLLVRMGSACHVLGIRKDIREKIGKLIGDEIEIVLEEDKAPRVIVLPDDLQQALIDHPEAQAALQRLSYTHQKEYVQWITEAKRKETRQTRINQMVIKLLRSSSMPKETPVKGPASYFPSIEKKYGQPISHWMKIIDGMKDKKHMEIVAALKSDYQMGHGHANALVAYHKAQGATS